MALTVGAAACGSTPTTPNGGGASAIPLAITCPAALSATAAGSTLTLTYASPATVGGTLPVTSTCTPASGTAFSRGTTAVTCRATDAANASASCSFNVTVSGVPLLKGPTFLAFGDSFTEGEILSAALGLKRVDSARSYPHLLEVALQTRYSAQPVIVSNRGLSGESLTFVNDDGNPDRAEDTRLRYGQRLTVERPDAVLLLEGVNDLNVSGISNVNITDVLARMVREAYAAGAKQVYLATLPPQIPGKSRSGQAARVPDLNTLIRTTATTERATLVDVYAAMIGNINTMINAEDGLHPLPAGYQVMADTFLAAIRGNFEQAGTSSASAIR